MYSIDYEDFEKKMLKNRKDNSFYESVFITLKQNNKIIKKEAIKIVNENFLNEYICLESLGKLNYEVFKESELFKKPYFLNKNVFISKEEHLKYLDKALNIVLEKTLKKYQKQKKYNF